MSAANEWDVELNTFRDISTAYILPVFFAWRRLAVCSRNVAIHIRSHHSERQTIIFLLRSDWIATTCPTNSSHAGTWIIWGDKSLRLLSRIQTSLNSRDQSQGFYFGPYDFLPLFRPFYRDGYTISTQGVVGCSPSVLREGWKADVCYSGRGGRRTIKSTCSSAKWHSPLITNHFSVASRFPLCGQYIITILLFSLILSDDRDHGISGS